MEIQGDPSSTVPDDTAARINRAGNRRGLSDKNLSLMRPGVSGNPNGRPKKPPPTAEEIFEQNVKKDLRLAAKEYTGEALRTILDIMRDKEVAPQYRLQAASTVLDRGHGKAIQQTEISVGVYEKLSDAELIKFITGQRSESMIDVTPERTDETVDQDQTDDQDETESTVDE